MILHITLLISFPPFPFLSKAHTTRHMSHLVEAMCAHCLYPGCMRDCTSTRTPIVNVNENKSHEDKVSIHSC